MKNLIKMTALASTLMATTAFAETGAYLEITLAIDPENRAAAADVYVKYKEPFLTMIDGAESKTLLVRDDDVQVLHGFETVEAATAYLSSDLFEQDVFVSLSPFVTAAPDVRIYSAH